MSESNIIELNLEQVQDYEFRVNFPNGVPALTTDEPIPLGTSRGPSPVQLLVTAVGNCLTDSLLFALRKFKQNAEPLRTEARATVGRNAQGRLRVQLIEARLHLGAPASELSHLDRILGQFENFCTVTQSVAQGLPVRVEVLDSTGTVLHRSDSGA